MIKLKKGDCVDAEGLNEEHRNKIIDYFLECGCTCPWTDDPHNDIYDRFVFWSKSSNYLNGNEDYDRVESYNIFNGVDLLAELRSQDDKSNDLTMEELREKHKEIREASDRVLVITREPMVNRNVVFCDYESNHLPGAMEITITDNEEVTVSIGNTVAYDNVESKKNIEETVDMLKVWRDIIDASIKEMEE